MSSKLRAALRAGILRRALERDLTTTGARLASSAKPAPTQAGGLTRHLHRLQLTLLRIRHRDYGKCAACGQPIADVRLKLIPTAGTCATCQASIDAQARNRGDA